MVKDKVVESQWKYFDVNEHLQQMKNIMSAIHHLVNALMFVSLAMYKDADDKISKQVTASFCLLISRTADDCKHTIQLD